MVSPYSDTIEHQKGRPFFKRMDITYVPLRTITLSLRQALEKDYQYSLLQPESEALKFYMWNHAASSIAGRFQKEESLGEYVEVFDRYVSRASYSALSMFRYLLLICNRESRHVAWNSDYYTGLTEVAFGPGVHEYAGSINGVGETSSKNRLLNWDATGVTLGGFCKYLVYAFEEGNYGGGYGGKPWLNVAQCLNGFVTGELSAEMLLDTAFTLAHNNGPIFNKGMVYNSYSTDLHYILDVQRAGQIPNLLNDRKLGMKYLTAAGVKTEVMNDFEWLREAVGGEFLGHVDWRVVQTLGAVNDVEPFIETQKQAPWYSKKAAKLKAAESYEYYEVQPGLKVKKTQRAKAFVMA